MTSDESSSSITASTTTGTDTTSAAAPVVTEAPASSKAPSMNQWALPPGIEDDIEQALFKATAGALIGGVVGLVCFKGGKGSRVASVATGVGAGLGSTYERIKFRYYETSQESK